MVTLNFKTTKVLANELNTMIKVGFFKDESEAINKALRFLGKIYKANLVKQKMEKIREKTTKMDINLTQEIVKAHEEED